MASNIPKPHPRGFDRRPRGGAPLYDEAPFDAWRWARSAWAHSLRSS